MSNLASKKIIHKLSRRFFLALSFIGIFSIVSFCIYFFNAENTEFLKLEKILLLFFTLALLFSVWFFVYTPIKKRLNYYIDEVIKKDNQLMQANNDLEKKINERTNELTELNKFNETLLHTIPLGMQVVDTEGTILYSNEKMKKLAGFDTVGKKCWSVIHDDKIPCSRCIRAAGMKPDDLNICELQQVLDGKTAHIYQAHINYNNSNAVLELFVDITQLKETEQKLLLKNSELNAFIFRASHDMRSPVANLLGLVHTYRNKFGNTAKIYIDFIEQSAKRMDDILLELIKIGNANRAELNISPINFTELIGEIKKQIFIHEKFSEINFSAEVNFRGNFISDKTLLYSVFHNLIENSIKYRNKKIPNPYVLVRINNYGNGAAIQVSDNGQGMTSDMQNHAFEMFYRANESSKGTGLGLYMVKISVEKLGGTIGLRSEKDLGTTVSIFIPSANSNMEEKFRKEFSSLNSV